MRKQTIALLLTAVMAVGGVLAQGGTKKSAVDEPVINYFDPKAGIPCQECKETEEQTCQQSETPLPCLCEATSGSETGNMVQAHLDDQVSSECVPLYRSIQ